MKKAIIETGAKQYLVVVGDRFAVELLKTEDKILSWQPLLLIDDDKVTVGKPRIEKALVKAKIIEEKIREKKVTSIRFKAKKRVLKRRGHRQQKTLIEITEIT